MSVRQKRFAKDSKTCQFAKNHSPKSANVLTCQPVILPNTIRQRFVNVFCRQKPFVKDSPMSVRQYLATCQCGKNDSPKIRQRVGAPKTTRLRFANVSVRQGPFSKYSTTCQLAKNHLPMIRQHVSSPKTSRQRFANV